jgi:hypothetical protein
MSGERDIDPHAPPPSAAQLRQRLVDEQMAEMKKRDKQRTIEQEKLAAFTDDFLKGEVTDAEIAKVRRLVMNAVKDGKLEALVYTFPSDLCSDSGRSINSGDPQWPESLRGKARQFYERFLTFGKPQGFKLKAMVVSFPGGVPGDIGFFLSWAPEAK